MIEVNTWCSMLERSFEKSLNASSTINTESDQGKVLYIADREFTKDRTNRDPKHIPPSPGAPSCVTLAWSDGSNTQQ